MGCWNEFDPITHTPIYCGEPAVMVLLTPEGLGEPWWMGSWFEIPRQISGVYKGAYNDYGWLEELPFDEDARPDYRAVFFHKSTWDSIVAKYGVQDTLPISVYRWEEEKEPEFLGELLAVMGFAVRCKLNLSAGLPYKGCQAGQRDEQQDYAFLQELVASGIARMNERYQDE